MSSHRHPVDQTPSGTRLSSDNFIGRLQEVEILENALREAISGHGRMVMLVGEPGVGKTRTSQEIAALARQEGACVLWGRCYENPGAPPYWPWVQTIRSYIQDKDSASVRDLMGASAATIAEVAAEVLDKLPDLQPPSLLEDPDQARFRLFDAIANFFKNASVHQPLAIFLDNLHWADKPSLLLLEFLAHEIGNCRLLIVGTYRDIELSRRHPLTETLAELTRESVFQRIQLRGLDKDQVARFIEAATGAPPSEGLLDLVHSHSEGNPLFITELVRLLADEAPQVAVILVPGRAVSFSVPEGIREVIGKRLNQLSEDCAQLLSVASVIGREFSSREMEALADRMSEDRLLEVLEEALAQHILEESPQAPDRYQFSHVLIKETLYEELSVARRSRLHRRIGEAMEDLYRSSLESHLAQLAYHFIEAAHFGGASKAVNYARQAGDRDMALLAYEEAARQYDAALQAFALGPSAEQQTRCDLLLALAEAQKRAGQHGLAMDTFQQAAVTAKEIGDPGCLVGRQRAFWSKLLKDYLREKAS